MAADMDVLDGQVIDPGRRQAAEQRAGRIVSHLAGAAEEIAQAILDEDWTAMGLSPQEWRARLFGDKRLTVEARRQVHELLSGEGMSTREIAEATGTPQRTVQRDLGDSASPDGYSSRQSGATASDLGERHETSRRPKPAAERSRGYRERKRQSGGAHPPDCPCEACRVPRPPEYKPPAAPDPRQRPGPEPQPCPGCRSRDEHIADLSAQLEKAHERLERLEAVRPDALVLAERDALAAERDWLAALVREQDDRLAALEAELAAARPSEAADSPAESGPADESQAEPGDPLSFDMGECQFPVPDEVAA
jgi:hypothetical protein